MADQHPLQLHRPLASRSETSPTERCAAPIRVGLVQINNSFSNQNYLPLSVGMLQAHATTYLKHPSDYAFELPIYSRLQVDEAVERLDGSDIAFFSTYVWNFRISVEIARRFKAKHPESVVVFGGPQVPDRVDSFLLSHRFVDLACHGEGEAVAVDILECLPSRDWSRVPSVSYLAADGALIRNPKASRIVDLAKVPSPFLGGVFEPLMRANPREHWIGLWETNRGCPFSCTFCDWGSAVQAKVYSFDLERLYRELDWFADHEIEFIFCCDANFGILSRDVEIASYAADVKSRRGYPQALSVQNTKNATERAYKVQKILSDAGLNKGVAVALQSVDPDTLESIKRKNISTASYEELQRRFTRDRVETYTDLILGLPGETYDSFADGVASIIDNGQHNRIQFNNLSILPNAEMGDPEYQRKYAIKSIESKIINIHGAVSEAEDEWCETQELVVATSTMNERDWVRTRAFSWMTALLYYNKILQVPLLVLHEVCGAGYRELLEEFSEGAFEPTSTLGGIQRFFREKAHDIQTGGPEYCRSEEWLNVWWPADEYIFIKLARESALDRFYAETRERLQQFLARHFLAVPDGLLRDAVRLNQQLIKLPFQSDDIEIELGFNVWEFYRATLDGVSVTLDETPSRYRVNRTARQWTSWDEWYREVVWYGNKKGAYLYGNESVGPQLAGHH